VPQTLYLRHQLSIMKSSLFLAQTGHVPDLASCRFCIYMYAPTERGRNGRARHLFIRMGAINRPSAFDGPDLSMEILFSLSDPSSPTLSLHTPLS